MIRVFDVRYGECVKLDESGYWPERPFQKHTLALKSAFGGKAVVLSSGDRHVSFTCCGKREIFGEVISEVFFPLQLIDTELFLFDASVHPVEAHVESFGVHE